MEGFILAWEKDMTRRSSTLILRVLAAGSAVAVSGCAHSVPAASSEALPSRVMQGDTTAAVIRGVWRSRGYGWLLGVSPQGLRLHHETAVGCYPDPGTTAEFLEMFGYYESPPGGSTLSFLSRPGETKYLFDRIDSLPANCEEVRRWDPPAVFDVFAATFSEHYAFFEARGFDWASRVEANRAGVSPAMDEQALFDTMSRALRGLGDAHVGLTTGNGAGALRFEETNSKTLELLARQAATSGRDRKEFHREWLRAYRDGILQVILSGNGRQTANDRIFWGWAAPGVGYLNIVTMGGFADGAPEQDSSALNAVLDEALSAFQRANVVLVDVSNNRGGYDFIAREIANRFTDERRLAYTKHAWGAHGVPPQAFHVEPSSRVRFTGRVLLLTSDVTVSAGEVFTLAMRALPNVVHVGTSTRGALSDVLAKPLPNGWVLELSNEDYRDAEGRAFEGHGIPPHETLDLFPESDLPGGHASAVRRLVDDLGR